MFVPQIPYAAIGEGIALILIVFAFIESDSKGRIFLAAAYFVSFLLPSIFPSRIFFLIGSLARLFMGAGSFIYLKYQGYIGWR
jgi:hypothetical protein